MCSLPLECESAIQAHFLILHLQLIMMQLDSCFSLSPLFCWHSVRVGSLGQGQVPGLC